MSVMLNYECEAKKCLLKSARKSPLSFDDVHDNQDGYTFMGSDNRNN